MEKLMCSTILIAGGANIKYKDDNQWTALHFVLTRVIQILRKLLIDEGADVNAQNDKQETPAMVAEKKNHLETAAMIPSRGGHKGSFFQ